MTPEELAAARKWCEDMQWNKVSDYGRGVVRKLIDEIERLQTALKFWEDTPQVSPKEDIETPSDAWDMPTR